MQRCQDSCPKIKQHSGSNTGTKSQSSTADASSYTDHKEDLNEDKKPTGINNRRGPSQSQRSVKIGEAKASADSKDSRISTRESEESRNSTGKNRSGTDRSRGKNLPQDQKERRNDIDYTTVTVSQASRRPDNTERRPHPRGSERSLKSGRMAAGKDSEWNPTGHNPCASNCPMAMARDRAKRKAELRQQRLDDYLLTKGFSYFDDLCTCSSICLINQLRKDKFVIDILKSTCLFAVGMKLCDELDAWSIFG